MIYRAASEEILQMAREYPVVTVIGPRQSGKTTLVRSLFPGHSYLNLELPDLRALAEEDPIAFFSQVKEQGAILDEIQRAPRLLSYIQARVDAEDSPGRYILTGSNQLLLHEKVTQSLAGRTAIVTLLPLSIQELSTHGIELTRDEYIHSGFLPRIFDKKQDPTKAHANYYKTYVERDLRELIRIRDLSSFQVFMKLLAGRVGQVLNLSSLSGDVGVSSTTLKQWLSLLEASFVIFRLQPYFRNFGKRMIKSPKIYFVDVGLCAYLLGIERPEQVARDPLLGGLFENLVISELFKHRYNQGKDPKLYFYRDSNGREVDVIFERGREPVPIEIKSAMTFHHKAVKGLLHFNQVSGSKQAYLIYSGDLTPTGSGYTVLGFRDAAKALE